MEVETRNEHTETLSQATARPVSKLIQSKKDVCDEILKRLRDSGNEIVKDPDFKKDLYAHFQLLPVRYAMDVNPDRAEDVLEHKRLLEKARTIGKGSPVLHVRSVHVLPFGLDVLDGMEPQNPSEKDKEFAGGAKMSMLAPPSFGSSANLETLALEMMKPSTNAKDDSSSSNNDRYLSSKQHIPIHEITFSTKDRPKLLSELSSILAEVGLNIREAHVFSTDDGYSLDAFVVDGWPSEDTQELQQQLETILNMEKTDLGNDAPEPAGQESTSLIVDTTDDWEIDLKLLKYDRKVASGSFGDLYKGKYCGQDVAIKVLRKEQLNENLEQEFAQEVSILRKVRHKNVVQFIGACTRPPHLCIVTEFMSGGSVHDHLHKKQGPFKLLELLKIAIDVSKGMDYLHQCNIIHRDLKAANLLMDEYGVVKVADFGVARVKAQTGVMTAETGTYRWMAPEVIEHLPYDHKADVFSFGIVVWELLTGKLPYEYLTPLQAAVGVVQKGLRPTIPKNVHPRLADLLTNCWKQNPADRLEFYEITSILQDILKEIIVADEEKKKKGGVFSLYKKKAAY